MRRPLPSTTFPRYLASGQWPSSRLTPGILGSAARGHTSCARPRVPGPRCRDTGQPSMVASSVESGFGKASLASTAGPDGG